MSKLCQMSISSFHQFSFCLIETFKIKSIHSLFQEIFFLLKKCSPSADLKLAPGINSPLTEAILCPGINVPSSRKIPGKNLIIGADDF